ncbi:uncharacterized conserved protein [Longilinea arvoryzae]|uniref:Uncharacterized conserved protein n=1 Tax=Longilinea arvoryzae TaxID=360412 RepID=A0A0S7BKY1_9CHLR|nr:DUF58 domain-containing protein [Longilinea arvoryzae]GAP15732.1 uncharacterized conserved protein [Longilinea arvoryzae]
MNSKSNLVLLVLIALLLGALISRNGALALMALPFLVYLGVGRLTSPENPHLVARRSPDQARCSGQEPIPMTLKLENQGQAIPRLRFVEPMQEKMTLVNGIIDRCVYLPGGQSLELGYTFQASRGRYSWQAVEVVASDPFGLFEKTVQLPAAAQVVVLPAESSIVQLPLHAQHTLHAPGSNFSRQPGTGVDFWGVREYSPGDSLRWIDWQRVARHPGKLFSKEFEREEMADIGLLLDARAISNLKIGSKSLFEYSVEATAALARAYIRAGNRVSLLIFGGSMRYVYPGTGKVHLNRILDQLAACTGDGDETFNTLRYMPIRMFPSRSLMVLISPLQAKDLESLTRMRSEGYQVVVLAPDPVRFSALERRRSEVTPYAVRAARLERAALFWKIRRLGVQVMDWPVDRPFIRMRYREHRP